MSDAKARQSVEVGRLAVDPEQLRNGRGIAPTEAALRRQRKARGVTLGCRQAPPRAVDAVGVVDQAETQLLGMAQERQAGVRDRHGE